MQKEPIFLTHTFKKPRPRLDNNEYYNTPVTTNVVEHKQVQPTIVRKEKKKSSVIETIVMGGEGTIEEQEVKKFNSNDVITAFLYGIGFSLLIAYSLIHFLNN